jgi:hypothetical protein
MVATPPFPNARFGAQRGVTEWSTTDLSVGYPEKAINVEPSAIVPLATTGMSPKRAFRRTPCPALHPVSEMSGSRTNPLGARPTLLIGALPPHATSDAIRISNPRASAWRTGVDDRIAWGVPGVRIYRIRAVRASRLPSRRRGS